MNDNRLFGFLCDGTGAVGDRFNVGESMRALWHRLQWRVNVNNSNTRFAELLVHLSTCNDDVDILCSWLAYSSRQRTANDLCHFDALEALLDIVERVTVPLCLTARQLCATYMSLALMAEENARALQLCLTILSQIAFDFAASCLHYSTLAAPLVDVIARHTDTGHVELSDAVLPFLAPKYFADRCTRDAIDANRTITLSCSGHATAALAGALIFASDDDWLVSSLAAIAEHVGNDALSWLVVERLCAVGSERADRCWQGICESIDDAGELATRARRWLMQRCADGGRFSHSLDVALRRARVTLAGGGELGALFDSPAWLHIFAVLPPVERARVIRALLDNERGDVLDGAPGSVAMRALVALAALRPLDDAALPHAELMLHVAAHSQATFDALFVGSRDQQRLLDELIESWRDESALACVRRYAAVHRRTMSPLVVEWLREGRQLVDNVADDDVSPTRSSAAEFLLAGDDDDGDDTYVQLAAAVVVEPLVAVCNRLCSMLRDARNDLDSLRRRVALVLPMRTRDELSSARLALFAILDVVGSDEYALRGDEEPIVDVAEQCVLLRVLLALPTRPAQHVVAPLRRLCWAGERSVAVVAESAAAHSPNLRWTLLHFARADDLLAPLVRRGQCTDELLADMRWVALLSSPSSSSPSFSVARNDASVLFELLLHRDADVRARVLAALEASGDRHALAELLAMLLAGSSDEEHIVVACDRASLRIARALVATDASALPTLSPLNARSDVTMCRTIQLLSALTHMAPTAIVADHLEQLADIAVDAKRQPRTRLLALHCFGACAPLRLSHARNLVERRLSSASSIRSSAALRANLVQMCIDFNWSLGTHLLYAKIQ
jgi:hypothetical protein